MYKFLHERALSDLNATAMLSLQVHKVIALEQLISELSVTDA